VASLVTDASGHGTAELGICGDFGGGIGDGGADSSRGSEAAAVASSSSSVATIVEVADGEGGEGATSNGTGAVSLALAGGGFSGGVGFGEEVFSTTAGLGAEAWADLAGNSGGISIVTRVGDIGLEREDGCILFAGRGGKRGVKSSGDWGWSCSFSRIGVSGGAGTVATLVCAEPYV